MPKGALPEAKPIQTFKRLALSIIRLLLDAGLRSFFHAIKGSA